MSDARTSDVYKGNDRCRGLRGIENECIEETAPGYEQQGKNQKLTTINLFARILAFQLLDILLRHNIGRNIHGLETHKLRPPEQFVGHNPEDIQHDTNVANDESFSVEFMDEVSEPWKLIKRQFKY